MIFSGVGPVIKASDSKVIQTRDYIGGLWQGVEFFLNDQLATAARGQFANLAFNGRCFRTRADCNQNGTRV
jgi:hypothetical protein